MTSNQITIALTKGRIEKDAVTLLEKAGFNMSQPVLDTVSQILELLGRMFWLNIRQAIWKC